MKNIIAVFSLLVMTLASNSLGQVSAQSAIAQAQQAVGQQITRQEGARGATVSFNSDAQTEGRMNNMVRVSGTGVFSNNNDSRYNNSRNNNSRNNNAQSREFSYEALVNNRNRNTRNRSYNNVSGIRYEWRGGWLGNNGDYGANRGQNVYCASNDGRRNTCAINAGNGDVRLVNQRSGAACVEGQTWGHTRTSIWVDRGCQADFEINAGRGNDRLGRGNNGNFSGERPNGRVSYSGPIMNRHSDKALDVTEQGLQDGANIQQWGFADQANQNWEVIDLGNNEIAILSRHSGKALTVQGGRDNNGANIIQRSWNNTPQQRWRREQVGGDYYKIVSVDNGKCLDVTAQGKQDGANIQLWDYANQSNQQWRFKR